MIILVLFKDYFRTFWGFLEIVLELFSSCKCPVVFVCFFSLLKLSFNMFRNSFFSSRFPFLCKDGFNRAARRPPGQVAGTKAPKTAPQSRIQAPRRSKIASRASQKGPKRSLSGQKKANPNHKTGKGPRQDGPDPPPGRPQGQFGVTFGVHLGN